MRLLIIFFLAILQLTVNSQSMGPLSGSQPKSFSLLPDNNGFLNNSVNLFTGQVQFSMPIMSLQGRGNLSYGLSISYSSSNVKELVNRRNREAPTGVLGLGWSLETPRIIADFKGTGTREDDDFYIVENGSANQLICSGIVSTEWDFYTKNYQAWKIRYNPTSEKWTIIREDGTKYIYGDNASGRSTVQYMVKWGNWIGNSSLAAGQQAYAFAWNLSETTDLWGDRITFEYLLDNERVSLGSVDHTKASYLKEIRNLNGERITLSYLNKLTGAIGTTREYVDPHQEAGEPDAFQEKYESKYLDKVIFYNENNELLNEMRFGYSSFGSLEFYKRQLISITQYNSAGGSLPGYQFLYETSTASTSNTGAMTRVTSPLKGTVNYIYDFKSIPGSNRELLIDAVANYAEPRIFIGEDYVVVTRRALNTAVQNPTNPDPNIPHDSNPRSVRVDLFTWELGKWIPSLNIATLNQVTLLSDGLARSQNFKVVLGKDFFGILNQVGVTAGTYDLKLFGKSNDVGASWFSVNQQFVGTYNSSNSYSDVNDPALVAGEDFVVVGSNTSNGGINVRQFIYKKNDNSWSQSFGVKPSGKYNYAAANNYYIAHKYSTNPDVITLDYLNKADSWQTVTFPSPPNTSDSQTSKWYATNSFALLMGVGTSETIYWWDKDVSGNEYATFSSFSAGALNDNAYVNFINNTMATIVDNNGYAFRFNGSTWTSSGLLDYSGPNTFFRNLFSFGDDFLVRPRNVASVNKFTLLEYNPNVGNWSVKLDNNIASTENGFSLLAGNNYAAHSGKFYFRSETGTWVQDPTVISYSWIKPEGGWNDIYAQGGYDFVATGDPYYPRTTTDPYAPLAISFKNGVVNPTTSVFPYSSTGLGAQRIWDRIGTMISSPQAALNTLVTYYGPLSLPFNFMEDASTLKIYRKAQDGFFGGVSTFVTSRFETNDGSTTRYLNYVYDLTTATLDASATMVQFNKATVVPDTDTDPATRPIGYTDSYFFNGLPSASTSIGGDFPVVGGNAASFYKKLGGVNYRSWSYDAANNLKSQSITDFQLTNRFNGFYVRPIYTTQLQDGQAVKQSFTYNTYGQQKTQTTENLSSGSFFPVTNESTYWWEIYDPGNFKDILAPVVLQRRLVNGVPTEVGATKWKYWDADSPGPYQSYSWNRQSLSTFAGYWQTTDPTPPSTEWKTSLIITNMDVARGLPLETTDVSGILKSSIWHATKPRVLAEASYASSTQIRYEGFEDMVVNTSATAIAGVKSSTVAYSVVLPSAGTYKLTYWQKVGAGNWQLTEQIISANTAIGGAGILIDEVRLHPVNSQMTSYSYDKFGNVITVCGPNNILSYFEFDAFNRLKLSRDKDRNIVEFNQYNVKN